MPIDDDQSGLSPVQPGRSDRILPHPGAVPSRPPLPKLAKVGRHRDPPRDLFHVARRRDDPCGRRPHARSGVIPNRWVGPAEPARDGPVGRGPGHPLPLDRGRRQHGDRDGERLPPRRVSEGHVRLEPDPFHRLLERERDGRIDDQCDAQRDVRLRFRDPADASRVGKLRGHPRLHVGDHLEREHDGRRHGLRGIGCVGCGAGPGQRGGVRRGPQRRHGLRDQHHDRQPDLDNHRRLPVRTVWRTTRARGRCS